MLGSQHARISKTLSYREHNLLRELCADEANVKSYQFGFGPSKTKVCNSLLSLGKVPLGQPAVVTCVRANGRPCQFVHEVEKLPQLVL